MMIPGISYTKLFTERGVMPKIGTAVPIFPGTGLQEEDMRIRGHALRVAQGANENVAWGLCAPQVCCPQGQRYVVSEVTPYLKD